MNLEEALATPPQPNPVRRNGPAIPAGDRPASYTWDGTDGVICTPAYGSTEPRPTTWDGYLADAGLDPEAVDVIEPVEVRGWDSNVGGGNIERLRYYRLRVKARRVGPSIDELVKIIGRKRPHRPRPAADHGGATYSVDLGDLQLGKVDGDGIEGTLTRAADSLDRAVDDLKAHRRQGIKIATVKLGWLGDGCEGFVSQGGTNAWRTILTMTEQTRILRRLMFRGAELFAPLTDSLIQIAIPGNHDQAVRIGGKGITRYDDSFDVEAMISVADALKLKPETYGHVVTHTPAKDELTVTIETAGTIVAHAHGHMWNPGKALEWWQGQAFGDQLAGQADVLYSGHLHHLAVLQSGKRTWIQVPAFESESTWWRHKKGVVGRPGAVTSILSNGEASYLNVV